MGRGGTERGGGAPKLPERRREAPSAVEYLSGNGLNNLSAEWRLGRPPHYETVSAAPEPQKTFIQNKD
jgi:hypothetical protein